MTVLSNDRNSWHTKLERIGELSARDRCLKFNNLGHLITVDMLKEQYQRLDGKKAVGIDKVTKADYGKALEENLTGLIRKIRRGIYRPKPSRIIEIPKEDGSTRPLAIACVEDKLIQMAVSEILTTIYEPLFLPCSYGYRPGRSCHDALRSLHQLTYQHLNGALVEIDIRKYFDTIPHKVLMERLSDKISDKRFLKLINTLVTAPIIIGQREEENRIGCPQGSIVSPILANIYLHHVVDEWFEYIKRNHFHGKADLIRFADDMVFVFEFSWDAKRFFNVLPKRLAKAGLSIHLQKSNVIPSGHVAALRAHNQGGRLPTFQFLGFTCYWGKSRKGFWRLKLTSRKNRFAEKLKGMKQYLRENLTTNDTRGVIMTVIRVVKGWVNYHNVSNNQRRVDQFLRITRIHILKWLNRRGGRRRVTWVRLSRALNALGFPRKGSVISMF